MNEILMTKHAIEQWRKRIDDDPPRDATKLLSECIMVQNRRVLYTARGREYKVLALYWHPWRRIFLKVDKFCVVTVLSENTQLYHSGEGRDPDKND